MIANPPAVAIKKRFVDVNLNRSLSNNPDQQTVEGKLALQLMNLLDGCDALLDLHAGQNGNPPFAICEPNALPIASYLPVSIVSTGWTVVEPGSTDAYMYHQNKPAICLECGARGNEQKYLPVAIDSIKIFLAYFDIIPQKLPPKQRQRLIDARYAVIKKNKSFTFSKKYTSFEQLEPNEIIAQDGRITYRAPKYPSCIIFPWPKAPIGAEAFVIGKTKPSGYIKH